MAINMTIGSLVTVRGLVCRVVKILPFGTIEVVALDDTGKAYRISGLDLSTGCKEDN